MNFVKMSEIQISDYANPITNQDYVNPVENEVFTVHLIKSCYLNKMKKLFSKLYLYFFNSKTEILTIKILTIKSLFYD